MADGERTSRSVLKDQGEKQMIVTRRMSHGGGCGAFFCYADNYKLDVKIEAASFYTVGKNTGA